MDRKFLSRMNGWYVVTFKYYHPNGEEEITWVFETKDFHEAIMMLAGEV